MSHLTSLCAIAAAGMVALSASGLVRAEAVEPGLLQVAQASGVGSSGTRTTDDRDGGRGGSGLQNRGSGASGSPSGGVGSSGAGSNRDAGASGSIGTRQCDQIESAEERQNCMQRHRGSSGNPSGAQGRSPQSGGTGQRGADGK